MKTYELLVLLKPILDLDNSEGTLTAIKSTIEKNGGKVVSEDKMGRKRLAYNIQKFRDSFMTDIVFEIEPDKLVELRRVFKLNEDIIRFMIATRCPKELAEIAKRGEGRRGQGGRPGGPGGRPGGPGQRRAS